MRIEPELRPRLSRAARLRFDRHSGSFVLLSPERGLRLNESAVAIVRRCTGEHTVGHIIDALRAEAGPHVAGAELAEQVLGLLGDLERRRLLVLEPAP